MSGRVLITGGAGFIGSHLTRALLDRGEEVVVLDSLEAQVHGSGVIAHDVRERLGAAVIAGEVGSKFSVAAALEGVDRVVHLAAVVGVGQSQYDFQRYVYKNTMSTAHLLRELVDHRHREHGLRLVVASSMSTYGEGLYFCSNHGHQIFAPTLRPDSQLAVKRWELTCPRCRGQLTPMPTPEDKALSPTSVYAITKRDQEELCLTLGAAHGIPTTALRLFNVYGTGQALTNPYTGVAAIIATALLRGEEPVIYEDGRQTRDFIHVSDIVRGFILALDTPAAAGHALNLGTGLRTSIRSLAEDLATTLNARPLSLEPKETFRSGDIRHCFADTEKARRLLGFKAEKSWADGIAEYAEWLQRQLLERKPVGLNPHEELKSRGLLL